MAAVCPKRMRNMDPWELLGECRRDFYLEQGIAIMPVTTSELSEGTTPVCHTGPARICFIALYKYTDEMKRTGRNHLGLGQGKGLEGMVGQQLNRNCEDSVSIGRNP